MSRCTSISPDGNHRCRYDADHAGQHKSGFGGSWPDPRPSPTPGRLNELADELEAGFDADEVAGKLRELASSPLPAGGLSEEELVAAVNAIAQCEACEGVGTDMAGWHDCKTCGGKGFVLPSLLARLASAPNREEGERVERQPQPRDHLDYPG